MNWWIFGGVVLGIVVLGFLAQRFRFIDLSGKDTRRNSGNGSGLMGIGDEVFAPSRHEAAVEMDRQTILPAPAPLAGDGDKGIYNGQVTIDLSRPGRHSK
ncbi:MAG: hypothetical protein JWN09_2010 [Microbacteriaceae bacterium]|jgi:hypothetical protein|nr:hypothetical protein [Microbacteriaceae bacterium]